MDTKKKSIWEIALIGAGCGAFLLFFILFVFGIDPAIQFYWINAPYDLLIQLLADKKLISSDDISFGLVGLFAYWMILGACLALIGNYLLKVLLMRRS